MEFISSIQWVGRGVAKTKPDKIQLDKDELKRIIEETKSNIEDLEAEETEDEEEEGDASTNRNQEEEEDEVMMAAAAAAAASGAKPKKSKESDKRKLEDEDDDVVSKYDLDNYDDDEDDRPSRALEGLGDFACFPGDSEDPYITLKGDVDSDDEDFEIKATDNLVVLTKVDKDKACVLEVHVYNGELGQFYPHHDYVLPAGPLVVEWLDYDIADGSDGNFAAVGSMEPTIDLWDLDVVDALEPMATLGTKEKPSKKKRRKRADTVGHTDAVLDLAWNKHLRNVLASGSADQTVALWDLSNGKVVASLSHHTDKVQSLKWHPLEHQLLLSGSSDCTAKVCDCRSPGDSCQSWSVRGEVESSVWNKHAPFSFLTGSHNGFIQGFDVRVKDKPLFTLSAHEGQAVTALSLSSSIPGLLCSASEDQTVRFWDVMMKDTDTPGSNTLVSTDPLVLKKKLGMGRLFCADSCPEAPFVFAIGGEREFKIWDIRESSKVRRRFMGRMPSKMAAECGADEGDISDDNAASAMEALSLESAEQTSTSQEKTSTSQEKTSTSQEKKKKKKKKKKKAAAEESENCE